MTDVLSQLGIFEFHQYPHASSLPSLQGASTSVRGHTVCDLERVITAMRKVVERLQNENERLRRSQKEQLKGREKVGELEKENKRLKVFNGK